MNPCEVDGRLGEVEHDDGSVYRKELLRELRGGGSKGSGGSKTKEGVTSGGRWS